MPKTENVRKIEYYNLAEPQMEMAGETGGKREHETDRFTG